jgi:hypothetical protein
LSAEAEAEEFRDGFKAKPAGAVLVDFWQDQLLQQPGFPTPLLLVQAELQELHIAMIQLTEIPQLSVPLAL